MKQLLRHFNKEPYYCEFISANHIDAVSRKNSAKGIVRARIIPLKEEGKKVFGVFIGPPVK